ncbi:SDR family NAD(P)-dependent oxidoreductase [Paenibacillus radicis (ex Gao et al. 2016)]|uniref:Short-chain dehydrogenase n=1 Tax=Paenibacillus radicis (ex Gao et al. 2016) TaxID=1737354 RepID=A0A917HA75_9BACL|nr:SDR family oxidoreductase [Paenibacillus radicis (ex Gao et al. 2016)]GGG72466.1 short-chain dehydrogenase [Paenibacillus radicis (ex Gao et al. 2016)]
MNDEYQVAIVTGGASGIGQAIASQLAGRQVFVVIADIDEPGGKQTIDAIEKTGGRAKFVRLDVTDADQVEAVVNSVYEKHGRLDYLFNNAGIAMYGELYDMSREHWERIVNLNLWGVIHGIQAAYPLMKKQGFGHIANTASVAGLGPSPTAAAYATTKHAIVGLTTSLHYEAETFGVKVSALCPTFVNTPIFSNGEGINMDKAKIGEQMKTRKMMSPEQFARIALKGIERNQLMVCPLPLRRTMDIFFILFPGIHRKFIRFFRNEARKANLSTIQ